MPAGIQDALKKTKQRQERQACVMLGLVVDRVVTSTDVGHLCGQHTIIVNQTTGTVQSIVSGNGSDIDGLRIITFPPDSTLLPGFIDCHVHLTIFEDDYQLDHLKLSSAGKALRALRAAQGLLHAGFTTIRSAGDADTYFPSFAVAKSIEKGEFDGPRIVGAGHYISVTGGGGDINFFSPDNCPCCNADGVIADGKEQMIQAVRKEIKYGADWIKILATGAFMSASTGAKDSPENTHMSEEELRACVEEANRRQVHVMAHAHGADGILKAANAGTPSIKPADSAWCHYALNYFFSTYRVPLDRARIFHRRRRCGGLSAQRHVDRAHIHDWRVLRADRQQDGGAGSHDPAGAAVPPEVGNNNDCCLCNQ